MYVYRDKKKEERGLLAWGQSSEIYEIKSWTDKVKKFPFSKYIQINDSICIVMHCKRGLFSTI
jgi:hypothetical protein